jgi:hypothetical protein
MDLHLDLEAVRADLLASGQFTEAEAKEVLEHLSWMVEPDEPEDTGPKPGTWEHVEMMRNARSQTPGWQSRFGRWGNAW